MPKYNVFIQTYEENRITDSLKATLYSLDDALAYRDWQTSGDPMLVAYVREEPESEEESVPEPETCGTTESDEERKRRQRREVMRRWRAKKKAQKGMQEAPGGGVATTLRATPEIRPQGCVSVRLGEDGKPVVFYREESK